MALFLKFVIPMSVDRKVRHRPEVGRWSFFDNSSEHRGYMPTTCIPSQLMLQLMPLVSTKKFPHSNWLPMMVSNLNSNSRWSLSLLQNLEFQVPHWHCFDFTIVSALMNEYFAYRRWIPTLCCGPTDMATRKIDRMISFQINATLISLYD